MEKNDDSEYSSLIYILSVRNMGILGHSIDPQPLFSAIMKNFFRKSIDVAIARFENSDITYFKVKEYIDKTRNFRA